MVRGALTFVVSVGLLGCWVGSAAAATTPGWECIPTTAGQPVVSGGTGAAPQCGATTTAVLAPTFVSSGVCGKPTVVFSVVNVQIVSGSGSTSGTVNGEGNLIIGYAENASGRAQTGSNDLVVGTNNGWSSFGELVAGNGNVAKGSFAAAFGANNTASGSGSFVTGHLNRALGAESAVVGGASNTAAAFYSGVFGGCDGLAGGGSFLSANCGTGPFEQTVLGGFHNTASGGESSVTGGESNTAQGGLSSVLGGDGNTAPGNCQAIPAAPGTC
jgi:hypothetical protein